MEVHQHISKWGNSLGLRIPAHMAESIGLKLGDDVHICVEEDKMIIRRVTCSSLSALPPFDVEAACAAYEACDPIPEDAELWCNAQPVGREIL